MRCFGYGVVFEYVYTLDKALDDLAIAKEQYEVSQKAIVLAEENYRIVQNRYLGQLAILTDLLDANNVLLSAELELTVARVTALYTYYELLNACGRL